MRYGPLNLPADRRDLIEKATSIDEGCVSVGGLASRIGQLRADEDMQQVSQPAVGNAAIARLVQLARRDARSTEEQFAKKIGIDVAELEVLETGSATSEPRVLYSVSEALRVSYEKLLVLAGHRQQRDEVFQREALRYAASSGSIEKLGKVEEQALHDLLKILHE